MALYSYNGPVLEFNKIVSNNWQAQTIATSEAKARSNIAHQFKTKYGKASTTKIALPGKIVLEGDE